jgi:penicillin-binding protein 1C
MSDTLKILSPNNGDNFLIDSTKSPTPRLEFKLTGVKDRPVEWWLNKEKIATNSSHSFFWQLRPGIWTLEIKSGDMTDTVTFQVQIARQKNNRRGFSVASEQKKTP